MRIWVVCLVVGAFLLSCSNKNIVRDEVSSEQKGLDEPEETYYVVLERNIFLSARFQLLRKLVLPLGMAKNSTENLPQQGKYTI